MAKISPVKRNADGKAEWDHLPGDMYVVTGVDPNGKRIAARKFDRWVHAQCINLYRGNKWLLRGGRRYLIQSVWN